jgi:hypothetical protein
MAVCKLTSLLPVLLMAGVFTLPLAGVAEDAVMEAEIEHLITAVGASGCDFIRNGKRYSSRQAEDHIRVKYRRGKRYATSTEAFIERLASQSSMSKKPYWIECDGADPVKSGDWLKAELERYRGL